MSCKALLLPQVPCIGAMAMARVEITLREDLCLVRNEQFDLELAGEEGLLDE